MTVRAAVSLVVSATLAVGAVFAFGFPVAGVVLRVYLLTVTAAVLATLVSAIGVACPPAPPSVFDQVRRRRPAPPAERPKALAELEGLLQRELRAGDVHFRLRPILREIAASRLSTAHGLDLDADSDESRRRLGPAAWELVRPDRPAPDDRFAPELDLAALRQVVAALEDVEWRP